MTAIAAIFGYLILAETLGFQKSVSNVFPNIEYFFAPLRLAEFCAGIFIAKLYCQKPVWPHATFIEAAVLATVLFNVCFHSVHYSLDQLSHLPAFAAMIWVFAHQQGAISRFLANQRLLVFLGEASFSLYMWHHLIMRWCNSNLPATTAPWLAISVAMGASLAISAVSFKWFEDPVRKWLAQALLGRTRHSPPTDQSEQGEARPRAAA
jgi:peptidoglycan/LPS O-acetylase OafA/YrhL